MTRFTQSNWNKLAAKIGNALVRDQSSTAVLAIIESWFQAAESLDLKKARVSPRKLATLVLQVAASKRSSFEHITNPCDDEPGAILEKEEVLSQRSIWRYFDETSMAALHRDSLVVFWTFFRTAKIRFGVFRNGFDVLIDEHQTYIYTEKPLDEEKRLKLGLPDLSLVSSAHKDGDYLVYRALTYMCMIAVCRRSGVAMPLAIILTCPQGRNLPPELKVPHMSPEAVINIFVNILETLYSDQKPWLLAFDKWFHANSNYARGIEYCNKRGTCLMTPARKEVGAFVADDGKRYSGVHTYMKEARKAAKRVHGTDSFYAVTKRDINGYSQWERYLVTFFRPPKELRGMHDGDPTSSPVVCDDGYFAYGFYTNHPDPEACIEALEGLYSRRWMIEHLLSTRVGSFSSGRQHWVMRRSFLFMVGMFTLCAYAIQRYRRYPIRDVKAVSRKFSAPQFVARVLRALPPPGRSRQSKG